MISVEDIKNYHCPLWQDLPDLELYMDQVISVLDKNLKVFMDEDKEKVITSTMINNYVKQKLVPPPVNKKYNKGHMASFFIITLLKQIMPIPEIKRAIDCVIKDSSPSESYDLFCTVFESSLHMIFFGEEYQELQGEDHEMIAMIRCMTLAYSNMLYGRYLLDKYAPKPESAVKEPKEKKKKNGRSVKEHKEEQENNQE